MTRWEHCGRKTHHAVMRLDSYEFHDCQASVQSGTAIERLSREITECVFSVEPKPQHVRVQLSVLERWARNSCWLQALFGECSLRTVFISPGEVGKQCLTMKFNHEICKFTGRASVRALISKRSNHWEVEQYFNEILTSLLCTLTVLRAKTYRVYEYIARRTAIWLS